MSWTERFTSVAGGGAHDGTSEANARTLAETIAAPYAAGQRINVKAGTYANTTTTRTFGAAGTTTSPIWWRGYNSAIGDLDADFVTAKPLFSFTTGQMVVSGAHQFFTNLDINGAFATGPQVSVTPGNIKFNRCRIENTNAAAASNAITFLTTASNLIANSWLKATASATRVVQISAIANVLGTTIVGGINGIDIMGVGAVIAVCEIHSPTTHGISLTTPGLVHLIGNSLYGCGADGFRFANMPGNIVSITGNVFSNSGGYDINNASGTNSNNAFRSHNLSHNPTSGHENGFGDAPAFSTNTDSSSPYVDGAGGDFTLVPTSNAIGTGIPGLFEGTTHTSYRDRGAVQRRATFQGLHAIEEGVVA